MVKKERKADSESEIEPLTILLPKDVIVKLDKLKEGAGFSGRGRTIQEAIDIIWELREDYGSVNSLNEVFKFVQPMIESSSPAQFGKLFPTIMPLLLVIFKRVGRFQEAKGKTQTIVQGLDEVDSAK